MKRLFLVLMMVLASSKLYADEMPHNNALLAQAAISPVVKKKGLQMKPAANLPASASRAIEKRLPDPVAQYLFDGNAEDSSGNDNAAIVTGAELVGDRAGNPDSAYLFYARLHQIKIPLTEKNTFASGSFTVSFWVKANKTPNTMLHLLTNVGTPAPFWGFRYTGQGSLIFMLSNQEGTRANITTPLSTGEWHHVTGTRNAEENTMSLYVDSALVETRPAVVGTVDSQAPIYAGDHKNLLFNGRMDDIVFWDVALGEDEMQAYHEQTAHPAQTVSYSPDSDNIQEPVGLYYFDGDAVDSSGQQNDAQVNAALPTQDRFGEADKAYAFYGRDNRIKIPLISANTFSKGSFSASCWVKINEDPKSMVGLVTNETGANQKWGLFCRANGYVVFLVRDKEEHHTSISHQIGIGTWHHVLGVRNASEKTIRLYVDKHLIDTVPFSGEDLNSEGAIWVGDGKNLIFRGVVDEVTLWRRALTYQEIVSPGMDDLQMDVSVPATVDKALLQDNTLNKGHLLPKK